MAVVLLEIRAREQRRHLDAPRQRANLDDAFTHRLDVMVDFPVPDEDLRRALWDRCLGSALPRSDDVDLDLCAAAFELSGGNIRSVAVSVVHRCTSPRTQRLQVFEHPLGLRDVIGISSESSGFGSQPLVLPPLRLVHQ